MSSSRFDNFREICLSRAYELCTDLENHDILDCWFDDEGALVIKSQLTDENGTQFFLTRLSLI